MRIINWDDDREDPREHITGNVSPSLARAVIRRIDADRARRARQAELESRVDIPLRATSPEDADVRLRIQGKVHRGEHLAAYQELRDSYPEHNDRFDAEMRNYLKEAGLYSGTKLNRWHWDAYFARLRKIGFSFL